MGCMLSSILTNSDLIDNTIGLPSLENCVKNYDILNNLDFEGASLHCEDYVLEKEYVDNFRSNFSCENFLA